MMRKQSSSGSNRGRGRGQQIEKFHKDKFFPPFVRGTDGKLEYNKF
jgi:hypothetical protein